MRPDDLPLRRDARPNRTRALARVALLCAAGVALNTLELPFPRPLPFAKPGFANLATLLSAATGGFREAFAVALVRPLLASLLTGSFLTPAFALSLAGGLFAWAAMSALLAARLAPLSVAVGGAVAHNLGQLAAAIVVLGHPGLAGALPLLLAAGALTGLATGGVATTLLERLARPARRAIPRLHEAAPWTSRPCA